MKVWAKALFLLVSSSFVTLAKAPVELTGTLTQGGIIIGKTHADANVFFNGKALTLSEDGHFVFGIGRDAKLEHVLSVHHNNTKFEQTLRFTKRDYNIQHVNGVEQKYVTPAPDVTERIARDNQQVKVARVAITRLPYVFDTPIMPAKGRISGVYGSQRVFNGTPRNPHYGLDVAAPVGAQVVAPLGGKVVLAEDLYYSGLTMIIDHGFGINSTFMHLSKFTAKVGDIVTQGDKIAEVGATGRVTGPHLDWRINWVHERLDPALLPGLVLPTSVKQ